jgi:hypothetical protein
MALLFPRDGFQFPAQIFPTNLSSFRSIQIPSDPRTREDSHLSVKRVLTMVTRCPQMRRLNSPSLRKDPGKRPQHHPHDAIDLAPKKPSKPPITSPSRSASTWPSKPPSTSLAKGPGSRPEMSIQSPPKYPHHRPRNALNIAPKMPSIFLDVALFVTQLATIRPPCQSPFVFGFPLSRRFANARPSSPDARFRKSGRKGPRAITRDSLAENPGQLRGEPTAVGTDLRTFCTKRTESPCSSAPV